MLDRILIFDNNFIMPNFIPTPYFLESIAVLCGLCNIYLAARAHILNWAFGIAMVSLYFIIFLQTKLYADMCLQMVFLLLQFYGWYQWLYGKTGHSRLAIQNTPMFFYPILLSIACLLFGIISWILYAYTDSTTIYLDASVTAMSLVAQGMMSKKWLEHWLVWMIVDVISIKLYLQKDLYFTSVLYGIFFMICLYGYIYWKRQLAVQLRKSLAMPTSLEQLSNKIFPN